MKTRASLLAVAAWAIFASAAAYFSSGTARFTAAAFAAASLASALARCVSADVIWVAAGCGALFRRGDAFAGCISRGTRVKVWMLESSRWLANSHAKVIIFRKIQLLGVHVG